MTEQKNEYKEGFVYQVDHSRHGSFQIKLETEDAEWISGIVVEGQAMTMRGRIKADRGDLITIRKSLCRIIPV